MSDINIKISVQQGQAVKAVQQLGNQAKKTERQFDQLSLSVSNSTSAFKVFAGNVAAGAVARAASIVTNGLGNLVSSSIESAQSLEDLGVQFEVLTGSAGAANEVIQNLSDFTARTPFQLEGVASAARQLISFGFEAETITDRLQDIGDVAAASGADINGISLIFGQVSAAGKLTGERLLQLEERAIPIGPALAKTLGVAESSVRDLVSQGKVSFSQFEQAFNSLNEEGQFAFGGIDKASQTLSGRISTLRDNFQLFAGNVATQALPAIKAFVTAVTKLIQSLNTEDNVERFADIIGVIIPQAIRFSTQSFSGLVGAIRNVEVFVNASIAGFTQLGASVISFAEQALQGAAAVQQFLGVDTSGIDSLIKGLKQTKNELQGVARVAEEESVVILESQRNLETQTKEIAKSLIKSYNEEKRALEEKAAAAVNLNQKQVESEAQKQEQLGLLAEAERERVRIADEENQAFIEFTGQRDFETLVAGLGAQEAVRVAAQAKRLQNEKKTAEASKLINDNLLKAQQQSAEAQIQLEQKTSQAKVNIVSATANLVSAATEQGSRAAFIAQKGAALAQAVVAKELAAAQALAVPPAPNFPLAGLARTAGNISIAAIIASTIRGFQDGGIVGGSSFSGDNVLARVNSGEMILNRQQQAQLFAQANGQGDVGGGREIVVNTSIQIDGEEIGRAVSRQVADGLELGEAL